MVYSYASNEQMFFSLIFHSNFSKRWNVHKEILSLIFMLMYLEFYKTDILSTITYNLVIFLLISYMAMNAVKHLQLIYWTIYNVSLFHIFSSCLYLKKSNLSDRRKIFTVDCNNERDIANRVCHLCIYSIHSLFICPNSIVWYIRTT